MRQLAARVEHRLEDPHVAGAAAQIAGRAPRGPPLRSGSGMRDEQIDGREDHPRRADAALRAAALEERLLHRVQLVAAGEAFDRGDDCRRRPGRAASGNCSPARRPAARRTRRTPLRRSLPWCRSGRASRQHVEQPRHRVHVEQRSAAVDGAGHADAHQPRLPPSASSGAPASAAGASDRAPVACATALKIAGAGPSIGSSPMPFAPPGPYGYGTLLEEHADRRQIHRRRHDVVGHLRVGHPAVAPDHVFVQRAADACATPPSIWPPRASG